MDKKHYHLPLPSRALCPICKKAVYSRGGIHPQCAMIQSEPPRPKKPAPGAIVPVDADGIVVPADDALPLAILPAVPEGA